MNDLFEYIYDTTRLLIQYCIDEKIIDKEPEWCISNIRDTIHENGNTAFSCCRKIYIRNHIIYYQLEFNLGIYIYTNQLENSDVVKEDICLNVSKMIAFEKGEQDLEKYVHDLKLQLQ